ncbi:hypothetical protein ACVI3U_002880 [Sinorhizobium medicae]
MAMTADAQVRLSLVDRITGPINRLANRLSGLSKKIGLDRVAASFGNLAGNFRGIADGVARSAGRMTSAFALLGTSFGGIVAGAYGVAKSTADVGAALTESSFKLGIGVEALQEYQYAAMMSGIESEKLEKGIEKLGINAAEAAKGNKTLRKEFAGLGVAVKAANGQMRPTEAILNDTLSALADIEDPIQRNRAAFKLLGKSGVDLVKMLGDGSEGLRDMRNEARRTGNVMSTEAAAFGDEFGDNVDRLLTRLQGLKKFLGVQLLPVMNELVESVTEWVDENQKLIRSNITDFVRGLGQIIKDLLNPASDLRKGIKDLADGFAAARDTIKPFVDFMGGPLKASLALIGLWALAPAIGAVSLLALAFGKLGVSIAGVAVDTVKAVAGGISSLFSGAPAAAEASGTEAGRKYGNAFSNGMRGAVRLGISGLGAFAAYQILSEMPSTPEEWAQRQKDNKKADEERNRSIMENGGATLNKWLGFDFLREKDDFANSPAKGMLDAIKGAFSVGQPIQQPVKVETVSAALALENAFKARQFGDGGTTEREPGKTKDDLGIGVKMPDIAVDPVEVPAIVTPGDLAVKPIEVPASVAPVEVPATVKPADVAIEPVEVSATVKPADIAPEPVEIPATVKPADIAPVEVPARLRVMEGAAIEPVEIPVTANLAGVADSVSKALKPASEIIIDPSRVGAGRDPMEVVPSLAKQAAIPFPTFTPENQPKTVEASSVEAGTMTAGNIQLPEPIIAHEPQNIDASTKIGSITINAKSDASADIKTAVNAALAENSRRTAAAVKSSLSD